MMGDFRCSLILILIRNDSNLLVGYVDLFFVLSLQGNLKEALSNLDRLEEQPFFGEDENDDEDGSQDQY